MRLINQLQPIVGESLISLLERLRQENYYEEASWFRSFLAPPAVQHPNLLRSATHYHALSELTGLEPESLWYLTLHRYVPHFYLAEALARLPGEYDDVTMPLWEARGLGLYVHGQYSFKVCPLCWREQHGFLLPWSLRHVTTCSIHHVFLVDRCSMCGTSLRVTLAEGACASCGERIEDFPTQSIHMHEASRLLTTVIAKTLGSGNGNKEQIPSFEAFFSARQPFSRLSSITFLQFLWRFGQLLTRIDPHNPLFDTSQSLLGPTSEPPPLFMRTARVVEVHRVLIAILELLLHWPDAFHLTLERIITQERTKTNIHARFPYILSEEFVGPSWTWLHQEWMEFTRKQASQSTLVYPWLRYYRNAHRSIETNLPPLLSQGEAARLLHMGERSLRQSMETKELKTTVRPQETSRRAWQFIDAESVQELQAQREALLSLFEAAAYCQVSEEQVVALVTNGMLRAEHGPLLDATPTWSFTRDTLQQFLDTYLGHLPRLTASSPEDTLLSLSQVLRVCSAVGERLPNVLQAVKQYLLAAYYDSEYIGVQGLSFKRGDVALYLKKLHDAKERSTYTVEEVCTLLHCKMPVLQRWQQTGLLVPCKRETRGTKIRVWYAVQDVIMFRERYITSEQAAKLVECTVLTIQHWAKAGRLVAVSGSNIDGCHVYRFEKEVLIQWRYERLTVGEAALLLGVSISTIDRWTKEGRIESFQYIGGKQRWFSRQSILKFHETKSYEVSSSSR